jgi:hypothetical protein
VRSARYGDARAPPAAGAWSPIALACGTNVRLTPVVVADQGQDPKTTLPMRYQPLLASRRLMGVSANARHCGDTMKHARTFGIMSTIAAVASLGAGTAQTLPADAATAPLHAAARYVVIACDGKARTEPASWTFACADYGVVLYNMHWTSWTSHLASGYGTVYENDNYPSHADGKVYKVPAIVTLWGSARVAGHPRDRTYTEMTLIFPGKRPAVYEKINGKWVATYPQTQTWGPF